MSSSLLCSREGFSPEGRRRSFLLAPSPPRGQWRGTRFSRQRAKTALPLMEDESVAIPPSSLVEDLF